MTARVPKFPFPVCFISGFNIRHGVALSARAGVCLVDCGNERIHVWQDDIFLDTAQAQHALNFLLN